MLARDKERDVPGVAALIDGLTLRNITITKPSTSPGVLVGNASLPMRNVVFDGVVFEDPPDDGAFGKDYFHREGVDGGVARGGTWPCRRASAMRAAPAECGAARGRASIIGGIDACVGKRSSRPRAHISRVAALHGNNKICALGLESAILVGVLLHVGR